MATSTEIEAVMTGTDTQPVTSNGATIFDLIASQQEQFALAMANQAEASRMVRIINTEVRRNPKLGECTPVSLLGAAMLCAQLRLEPGPLEQVYLIPRKRRFKNGNQWGEVLEVNWQLGYKGMIELAHRTGKVKTLHVDALHKHDEIDMSIGTSGGFTHRPNWKEPRGEVLGYYCYAELVDGGWTVRYLTLDEINDGHRARSDAWKHAEHGDKKYGGGKKDSPWHTDYDAMCRKTLVRVTSAWLPRSAEIGDAVYADDAVVTMDPGQEVNDVLDLGIAKTLTEGTDQPPVDPGNDNEEERPEPRPERVRPPLEAGEITVDRLIELAKDAGLIPANARVGVARKALLSIAEDATGTKFGTADDVLPHADAIIAHLAAASSEVD